LVALGAYLLFVGGALIDILKGRKARDYAEAAVLREFFSQLHGELFPEEENVRVTLFCQAPEDDNYIVPLYRYTAGTEDLLTEARKSQARFRRGEGFTGLAWENAGEDIVIANLPAFADRNEFEDYFVRVLKISADAVKGISDHMVGVRTVLSHGFIDSQGGFLGLLTVDLLSVIEMDEVEGRDPQQVGAIRLNAGTMIQILNSIENVLEAFARVKRGQDEYSTSI